MSMSSSHGRRRQALCAPECEGTIKRAVTPTVALAVAASCGLVRWAVIAQTADVAALGLVQPLHGFTFALLHLASMRIITDTVPRLWPQPRRRSMVSSASGVRPPFCCCFLDGFTRVSCQPGFGRWG